MASDRQQYARAMEKWHELQGSRYYSRPVGAGVVGIVCSYWPIESVSETDSSVSDKPPNWAIKDRKTFRKEALKIADIANEHGRDVDVALNARSNDFFDILSDPSISDLVVIGNGSLSDYFLPDYKVSWLDVSEHSDHLKQGDFTQRHCGAFSRELSVPLGMFAVNDFASVYAAVGHAIYPRGLHHKDSALIGPIFDEDYLPEYEDIKGWFSYGDE